MTVRDSLMQYFMCMGPIGLPMLVGYDQATGRLEPIYSAFLPQQPFEGLTGSQPKLMGEYVGSCTNSGFKQVARSDHQDVLKSGFRPTKQSVRGILIEENQPRSTSKLSL